MTTPQGPAARAVARRPAAVLVMEGATSPGGEQPGGGRHDRGERASFAEGSGFEAGAVH